MHYRFKECSHVEKQKCYSRVVNRVDGKEQEIMDQKNKEKKTNSVLDNFVDELQEELWAGYSKTVVDHAQNPRNVGSIPDPDGYGSVTGPCGDTMQIWLRVKKGTITDATFWTDGCGTTIATGSMITEIAKGKSIEEAQRISSSAVLNALGGLPEESLHCATLAAETLKAAFRHHFVLTKETRKRNLSKKIEI